MPQLELVGVTKSFDGGPPVVAADLAVEDGEFLALLGPSGSGKTTLVRIMAGLEAPSEGRVLIDGEDVTKLPPAKRGVAVVFQEWALYPHLTAGGNMAFPMKVRRADDKAIDERVGEVAESLSLARLLDRRPTELSAGHRHGVATGRALVGGGSLLLMDEPLANLDASLRRRVRLEVRRLQQEEGTTIVYATNDQEEATALADRVAVIGEGRIQQVAAPAVLYRRPRNTFVAGFVGSPPMNLARAAITSEGDGAALWLGSRRFEIETAELARRPGLRYHFGEEVLVGIRPEHMRMSAIGGRGGPEQRIGGEVTDVEFLGSRLLVHFVNDGIDADGIPGAEFQALVEADHDIAVGQHLALAVDVARFAYFDPGDGHEIWS